MVKTFSKMDTGITLIRNFAPHSNQEKEVSFFPTTIYNKRKYFLLITNIFSIFTYGR
ncbi:hypothetical protein ATK78_3386 [Pedobacter metabolipauper]|uniref:Uncharacterized protein n=1 Tax=Pedobacter metabolipauper TaxID=425513 RepID=A0A4R6SUZ7_9SPHI|nr:hypothetical protein ATK78_3386 [Pedobacter metabolipauper]